MCQVKRSIWRGTHFRRRDRRLLYDAIGPEFAPPRSDAAIDVAHLELAARESGLPLKVLDRRRPKAATYYGGRLVLSRPDQHVAWRGDGVPAGSLALIDRVSRY